MVRQRACCWGGAKSMRLRLAQAMPHPIAFSLPPHAQPQDLTACLFLRLQWPLPRTLASAQEDAEEKAESHPLGAPEIDGIT